MSREPSGRVAVVTGAGTGIGRAIARDLGRAGAAVALLGRRPEPLESLATILAEDDVECAAIPCDVTVPAQVEAAMGLVRASLGPIEILVNNAGLAPSGPLHRVEDAEIDRVMDLNVEAPFRLAALVRDDMKAAGFGRIVNVASTAGLRGYRYNALYVTTKHALVGLTRSLSAELLPEGITVNAVCPGFVETAIVETAARRIAERTEKTESEAIELLAAQNPLGRLVTPREVAAAVLYLVSDGSGAVSGHQLVLDGGTQAG